MESTTYMRIPEPLVTKNQCVWFQVNNHNIFTSLHIDPKYECKTLPFAITQDDINTATVDWLAKFRTGVSYTHKRIVEQSISKTA